MLSYQVREYYEFLGEKLGCLESSFKNIIEFGKEYNEVSKNTLKLFVSAIYSGNDSNGEHYSIRDNTKNSSIQSNYKSIFKNFKMNFELFDASNDYAVFKKEIEEYVEKKNIQNEFLKIFLENVDIFFKQYQNYIKSDNDYRLAVEFGQAAMALSISYGYIKEMCKEITESMYENNEVLNEGSKSLSIQLLEINYNIDEFANKLMIISEIYNDIGIVIYKGEPFESIKVKKIESGSLLSRILGDQNIIEAFAELFKKTVNLVFNKFTREGKILRHKELREELVKDVELTEIMKGLGYDISDAKINNTEALTKLTKNLADLATSSSKIKINNEEYGIQESNSQKFIEESRRLMLGEAKDSQNN